MSHLPPKPAHDPEFEALVRAVELARGRFSLIIAECASPARIESLTAELEARIPGTRVFRARPETGDILHLVAAIANDRSCTAIAITGYSDTLTARSTAIPATSPQRSALAILNASRDLWLEQVRCPVVLWLAPFAVRRLISEAPDLWSFRAHWLRFDDDGSAPTPSTVAARDLTHPAGNLPADLKRERLAELRRRVDSERTAAEPDQRRIAIDLQEISWLAEDLGLLDQARDAALDALTVAERLSDASIITRQYSTLGRIERTRGNLDAAEGYFKKALAINEKLGRPEGMAIQYGNLGLIERTRGNLDAAEGYHRKALAIEEKLGRPEGMAIQYGNLGLIEHRRGNLDAAEGYQTKALAIDERLGNQEGIARHNGNLGNIEFTRGNLDASEGYYTKALVIHEKLGNQKGMAINYGNLGLIEKTRGNLDAAEGYHKKSLALNEKLGRPEGMAISCDNLGIIAKQRGDFARARELWTKSRDLHAKIGMPHMVKRVQGWLDGLPAE